VEIYRRIEQGELAIGGIAMLNRVTCEDLIAKGVFSKDMKLVEKLSGGAQHS
jgi:hypothetical protein